MTSTIGIRRWPALEYSDTSHKYDANTIIHSVFPRCAHSLRASHAPDQLAHKLRKHRVIGHYVLLCGAGCCLWTRGFSGCRARPWGRAAPWAARPLRPSAPRASIGASARCPATPPTGTAVRPSDPSGALRTGGAFGDVARRVALMPSYGCQPPISHAIPPRLFQILNSQR